MCTKRCTLAGKGSGASQQDSFSRLHNESHQIAKRKEAKQKKHKEEFVTRGKAAGRKAAGEAGAEGAGAEGAGAASVARPWEVKESASEECEAPLKVLMRAKEAFAKVRAHAHVRACACAPA